MSVAKIIELVASSDESWDDAVRNAVAEAARPSAEFAESTSRTGPRASKTAASWSTRRT